MNKKSMEWGISLLLGFLLVLGFYLTIGQLLVIGEVGQTSGFLINSLSANIIYSSTGELNLEDSRWLATITLNRGGQNLIGEILTSDFADETGEIPTEDLKITLVNYTETFSYSADNRNPAEISLFSKTSFRKCTFLGLGLPSAESVCAGYDYYLEAHDGSCSDYFCINEENYGYVADIGSKVEILDVWLKVQIGTNYDLINLKKVGDAGVSSDIVFGNEIIGNIQWSGKKVDSGDEPVVSTLVAVKEAYTQNWKFGKASYYYSNYAIAKSNIYSELGEDYWTETEYTDHECWYVGLPAGISGTICPSIDMQNYLDSLVAPVQNAVINLQTEQIPVNADSVDTSIVGDNVVFHVNPDSKVYSPELTLSIEAEWLGVEVSKGQPLIISVDDLEFSSGSSTDEKTGIIRIKNTGQSVLQGTMEVNCNNANFVLSHIDTIYINPSVTEDIEFIMSESGLNMETSTSCSATVYDINYPSNSDTKYFSVELHTSAICNEGEIRPDVVNDNIEICSDNMWVIQEHCDYGIIYKDDEWKCDVALDPEPLVCPQNQTLCADETCQIKCTGTHNCPPVKLNLLVTSIKLPNLWCWIQVTIQGIFGYILLFIVATLFFKYEVWEQFKKKK